MIEVENTDVNIVRNLIPMRNLMPGERLWSESHFRLVIFNNKTWHINEIKKFLINLKYLGKISAIIVAGGFRRSNLDILPEDLGIKQLPNLPNRIDGSSMVAHNGTILLCGGRYNEKQCLQWNHSTWKVHSVLNVERVWHLAVTTQPATFIFGGWNSRTTYEYLPKDSTTWLMGKTELPGPGFENGCAITVKSDQEIWLIGGVGTGMRILCFDVVSHNFQVLPFHLNVGRFSHRCTLWPKSEKCPIVRKLKVLILVKWVCWFDLYILRVQNIA